MKREKNKIEKREREREREKGITVGSNAGDQSVLYKTVWPLNS